MDIFNLRALVTVIDGGNVSRAASELGMTQAGLSMLLHRLETHYRVKLIERRQRGVVPTAAGQAVYTYAQAVLRLDDQLGQQLERARERGHGWVGVGATPTLAARFLPWALSELRRHHHDWQVTVETGAGREIRKRVLGGRLDFAIVAAQPEDELSTTPLGCERVVIVAPPGDPLAHQIISASELLRCEFVVAGRDSEMRHLLEAAIGGSERSRLKVAIEVSDPEAKKEAVRRGAGYGLMSESLVERELRDGTLCEIRVEGISLERDICLVQRKHGQLSLAASSLFALIKQSQSDHPADIGHDYHDSVIRAV